MEKIAPMVDMAIKSEERKEPSELGSINADLPRYPYGLAICLTHDELEKLDVDYGDWQVGDHFHLHALAKITSISQNETESGQNCRVEMQIVALSGENEEEENEESDEVEDDAIKVRRDLMRKAVRSPY